ncbi:hypothetical protein ACIHFD_49395 [Nonomuraea sp. NPDC051941]|uniref:hypothetical protein n=1 Tax=Nonomuraea sp. NPDC051941 TaxID=3364373 RepID=UPI0037C59CBA
MATLLAVFGPGGRVQRCDAGCYNARGKDCDCICEGGNHGRGLQYALVLSREQYQRWIARAREKDPEIEHIEIGMEVQAIPLFDEVVPA